MVSLIKLASFCLAATGWMMTGVGSAFAQGVERREAHAHVHGAAEMSFVIDRDRLLVELAAPMGDMVGFESAPKNAADRMKIDQATRLLNDAARVVAPATAAGCRVTETSVRMPFGGAARSADHHDHDPKGSHVDVEASYVFACRSIGALDRVEVTVFRTFPELETIEAVFLGPRTQVARKLKSSSPVFRLK